jgi:type I restriction enzyme S subunit
MSWGKVKLEDLCEINMGKTPSRSNSEYWNGDLPWVSIADLKGDIYINETKECITDKAVIESGIKIVPKNTLLYSFKLSIGKVAITGRTIYTNEAIVALPIKDKDIIDLKYLYWAIQEVNLDGIGDKAVMGLTLNKEKLKKLEIPLPPFPIQKRIAEILDAADALRRKDQELLNKYDELAQAIFIDMFGDPVKNEKGWKMKKIKEFGKVQTGNTPPRAEKKYYGSFIEWIKTDNMILERINPLKATEYLSEEGLRKGRYVEKGSVLVTCIAGSSKTIGNVVLADRIVAFNQQINSLTPKSSYNKIFIYALFRYCKSIIQDNTTQGMKRIITNSTFENIKFISPPIELQNEFEKRYNVFINMIDVMTNQNRKSKNLFNSLINQAFKGELVK